MARGLVVGVAVQAGGAGESIIDTVARDRERLLRQALERDNRQMRAPAEITDA